jgi:hypothetical protein
MSLVVVLSTENLDDSSHRSPTTKERGCAWSATRARWVGKGKQHYHGMNNETWPRRALAASTRPLVLGLPSYSHPPARHGDHPTDSLKTEYNCSLPMFLVIGPIARCFSTSRWSASSARNRALLWWWTSRPAGRQCWTARATIGESLYEPALTCVAHGEGILQLSAAASGSRGDC